MTHTSDNKPQPPLTTNAATGGPVDYSPTGPFRSDSRNGSTPLVPATDAETAQRPETGTPMNRTTTTTTENTDTDTDTGTESDTGQQPETETDTAATGTTDDTTATTSSSDAPEGADDTDGNTTANADGKDWQAEADKWKSLSRKNEDEKKALRAELDKLRKQPDSSNPEMQRLAEQIEELRAENEANKRKALIAEVAEETQLTVGQARRLQGSTKEELLQDAEELIATFGIATTESDTADTGSKNTKPGGRRPKEKLRPGATTPDDDVRDPDEIAEAVLAKRRV